MLRRYYLNVFKLTRARKEKKMIGMWNAVIATGSRPRLLAGISVLMLGMAILTGPAYSGGRSDDPLGVAVSPQTMILDAEQGSVSVHTSIPFSSVDKTKSVTLNGVEAIYIKADDCGNLVAKYDEFEIKAIISPPAEVMVLKGFYTGGGTFSGSDTVRVIISNRQ
jgi:hypothetical protein